MPAPVIDPDRRNPGEVAPTDTYQPTDPVWVYRGGAWRAPLALGSQEQRSCSLQAWFDLPLVVADRTCYSDFGENLRYRTYELPAEGACVITSLSEDVQLSPAIILPSTFGTRPWQSLPTLIVSGPGELRHCVWTGGHFSRRSAPGSSFDRTP